ncbi:MAG: hypothetical protein ACLSUQ_10140 [Monoglobus pectinilyticus]
MNNNFFNISHNSFHKGLAPSPSVARCGLYRTHSAGDRTPAEC